ncbi:MAG: lytic murein transglycosylase [Burkholderiaceae bacterium]|nr:lytic murein transglycosylase [Burkholderiaceae bacterium]
MTPAYRLRALARFARPIIAAGAVLLALPTPWVLAAEPGTLEPIDPAGFRACVARLQPAATAKGVDAATFARLTRGLVADASVLESLDYQPEFKTPVWDYLAALVDEDRIEQGRAMLVQWRDVLAQVESRYGVDARMVVAVWGVESNFGQRFGSREILPSLATLSCFGRRQKYFSGEFVSALKIVGDGHVAAEKLRGSWAGAFGHTQFMPSTFLRTAVDFDGDGRRDIVDSVPDALGSTANYLKRAGWRSGQAWGLEVALPPGFDVATAGRKQRRALADWLALGLRRADGGAIEAAALGVAPDTPAAVLVPALRDAQPGRGPGPAFLVFRNFDAIYSYNAAVSYALAIAHLADRLGGRGPFVTPWPTDDPGLGRAGRRALQALLALRGHDIGPVDGMVGKRTRAAIRAEEKRLGLPETGRAGGRILEALRAGR